jgi:hypothetical protein
MSDPVRALILDLLEWIGPDSRPYSEVIEVWRTSCPRLPVWEEANSQGFISHQHQAGVGSFVSISPLGRAFLTEHRQVRFSADRVPPKLWARRREAETQDRSRQEGRSGEPEGREESRNERNETSVPRKTKAK